MSRLVKEALCSGMELIPKPESDFENIIAIARRHAVRCLVIEDITSKRIPDILEKANRGKPMPLNYWKRGKRRVWLSQEAQHPGASIGKNRAVSAADSIPL